MCETVLYTGGLCPYILRRYICICYVYYVYVCIYQAYLSILILGYAAVRTELGEEIRSVRASKKLKLLAKLFLSLIEVGVSFF